MGPRLAQILQEHRLTQNRIRLKAGRDWIDNDLVFCTDTGCFLDGDNLYHRDFRLTLKRAGLRHLRIHDLRHTFASILIAAGHSPKYIQKQMGHSSITVTMDLYGHLMEEIHEGAAKRSEDFVFTSHLRHTDEKRESADAANSP
jgi:integrase